MLKLSILFVFLTARVASAQVADPIEQEGALRGSVLLGSGAIPMSGVHVRLVNDQGRVKFRAQTNESGQFLAGPVPAGKYTVLAFVRYTDPVTAVSRKIVNYPDWHPKKRISVIGGQILEVPPIVFPDPLILQAGYNGGLSTWTTGMNYLVEDPAADTDKSKYKIPAFVSFVIPNKTEDPILGYDNRALNITDHDANALVIDSWRANQIPPALLQWIPADRLDDVPLLLAGHSMGGVIVRAFATTTYSGQFPDVLRIASLDGTQGGTTLAEFSNLKALRESTMNGIASNFGCPPTYVVRPWNENHTDFSHTYLLWNCAPDVVVTPDRSAWGFGRTYHTSGFSSGCEIEWMSGNRVLVGDEHSEIHENPLRVRELGLFLAYGEIPPDDPSPPGLTGPPDVEAGRLFVHVDRAGIGAAKERLFLDPDAPIQGLALLRGAAAQFEIRSSSGESIPLQTNSVQALGENCTLQGFALHSPSDGEIELVLTQGESLDVSFTQPGPWRVLAGMSPEFAWSGEPVFLKAAFDPWSAAPKQNSQFTVTARVQTPSGAIRNVPLFDHGTNGDDVPGDGVFSAAYFDTDEAGRYYVEYQVTARLDGSVIQRSAVSEFAVKPQGVELLDPLEEQAMDRDGNGRIDVLLFTQRIRTERSGRFRLVADLLDSEGRFIKDLQSEVELTGPSERAMQLYVESSVLARHGRNGPFEVSEITLCDVESGLLECDRSDSHRTREYPLEAFDPPNAPLQCWLLPSSGRWQGGNEILLCGKNVEDVREVFFGNQPASFEKLDARTLRVLAPGLKDDRQGSAASVDLVLRTPWADVSIPSAYTYLRD